MNLPYLMIYKGDYLRHNVSALSIAAQGLWLRLMILMHDSERPGYLCLNGEPMPPRLAATKCSVSLDEYSTLLAELDSVGAFSRSTEGILFSPQIVDEAQARAQNAKRQREFKAKKANAKGNGEVTPEITEKQQADNALYSYSDSSSEKDSRRGGKPPAVIWDLGLSMLKSSGMAEKEARSFLGGLAKKYGKDQAAQAVASTSAVNPVNPKEYIVGVLEKHGNGSGASIGRRLKETDGGLV